MHSFLGVGLILLGAYVIWKYNFSKFAKVAEKTNLQID